MNTMHHPTSTTTTKQQKRKTTKGGESLKVVYISSPMKVRTSASRFRSLVQHLTGKNSDIAPYVDALGIIDYRDEDGMLLPDRLVSSVNSSDDTTTTMTTTTATATSDCVLGNVENGFASQIMEDDQFGGFYSSFCDQSTMDDVLGSYSELMM